MSEEALRRLEAVLGPHVVTSGDGGTVIVTPRTEEAVALACREARQAGWRIRIEGRRTWLVDDAPADMVLRLEGLGNVQAVSAADQVATVQAGVAMADLSERLAEDGMWLALDPPGRPERTLGSVVATGTSGPLRARFGPVRDHVLGCRVVTADGRLIESGGRVMKNVAGFDLTKLQVGGFGGFGIITAVHLRLRTLPKADTTLVARGTRDELTAAAREVTAAGIDVAALELLSPTAAAEPEWLLAARILGAEALVQSETPRLDADTEAVWESLPTDRATRLWRMVRDSANAAPVSFRLGVLADGLDEALDRLTHDLEDGLVTAGAAAGGLRWTGVASPEQLLALRHVMAQREIPMTLERAPWHLRHRVGHFGAYREGVGQVVDRLRTTFDPDLQLSIALERGDG
jgi:glycolate oxidase FAD binding subunit